MRNLISQHKAHWALTKRLVAAIFESSSFSAEVIAPITRDCAVNHDGDWLAFSMSGDHEVLDALVNWLRKEDPELATQYVESVITNVKQAITMVDGLVVFVDALHKATHEVAPDHRAKYEKLLTHLQLTHCEASAS